MTSTSRTANRSHRALAMAAAAVISGAVAVLGSAQPVLAGSAPPGGSADSPTALRLSAAPTPGNDWQWMLSSVPRAADLAATPSARAWDFDGFDARAADVDAVHALPALAVCYISAGSFEDWRPDAGDFPASVKGRALDGWAGEKWLDVRKISVLEPIMTSRMEMCRDKGFDAVEPDNVDGYTNRTGFPLTGTHQLAYNRMLADAAHALGLTIALKNDVGQVRALEPDFDFAINEQCYQYRECDAYEAFSEAGKAVWIVEYKTATSSFCPKAIAAGYDAMKKKLNLGAYRVGC